MTLQHPPAGQVHYFAFGSNMSTKRLQARIPEARAIGRGRLHGWVMLCNKSGLDGSAKANIEAAEGSLVWGVIFCLPESRLPVLDEYEGGYHRHPVEVLDDGERPYRCATYSSQRTTNDQRLNSSYRQHMVDGAQEHGLPANYVHQLASRPLQDEQ
jgi:gamma-glutamylcyclotransferase